MHRGFTVSKSVWSDQQGDSVGLALQYPCSSSSNNNNTYYYRTNKLSSYTAGTSRHTRKYSVPRDLDDAEQVRTKTSLGRDCSMPQWHQLQDKHEYVHVGSTAPLVRCKAIERGIKCVAPVVHAFNAWQCQGQLQVFQPNQPPSHSGTLCRHTYTSKQTYIMYAASCVGATGGHQGRQQCCRCLSASHASAVLGSLPGEQLPVSKAEQ